MIKTKFTLKYSHRHLTQGIFILGREYFVYPESFNDYMAKYILKNIAGFANYDEAMDKWAGYFNDCRKKERSAMVVSFNKRLF